MQLDLKALDDEQLRFITRSDHWDELTRIVNSSAFKNIAASEGFQTLQWLLLFHSSICENAIHSLIEHAEFTFEKELRCSFGLANMEM
jgi:hypothetical protein